MSDLPEKKGISADWAVAEVDQLFAALGHYTRFVVFSKWFLMLFALALVTVLIALPLVSKDRSGIRISFVDSATNTAKDVTHPVMSNPEYRGTDVKGQQFKINGIRATQVTQNMVSIEQVEAQLVTESGGWRSLAAANANYDQAAKTIELSGDVTLLDDQGYSFTTPQATVDMNSSKVTGKERITGTGPLGNLLASGFEIMDNGTHITFTGGAERVQLHIDRAKKK
jgi:lipopolysaccharide export system protein LptC